MSALAPAVGAWSEITYSRRLQRIAHEISGPDGMSGATGQPVKIHLSKITEEGWRRRVEIPISSLKRLVEETGQQQGLIRADIRLRLRGGNIEARGNFRLELRLPCNWCLEPVPLELEESFSATLAPERLLNEMEVDLNLSSGDLEISFFAGEEIDLAQLVEDEILLVLPGNVCREDEQGRCSRCGKDPEELMGGAEEEKAEHPFAKMKEFLQ